MYADIILLPQNFNRVLVANSMQAMILF